MSEIEERPRIIFEHVIALQTILLKFVNLLLNTKNNTMMIAATMRRPTVTPTATPIFLPSENNSGDGQNNYKQ